MAGQGGGRWLPQGRLRVEKLLEGVLWREVWREVCRPGCDPRIQKTPEGDIRQG